MKIKHIYPAKALFIERMKQLLPDEKDFQAYLEVIKLDILHSIRCNTLKINHEELKKRLETKGWKISQPFKSAPEIMIIESKLLPGEIGRAIEHLLGYYYVQEIASTFPILALNLKENETYLDLCASPGSKTTQAAAKMNNNGLIIANDESLGRIKILVSNLERCGVMNSIITKKEGSFLCQRLENQEFLFDKILVDAPCSGEGTIRSSPKTLQMWNINSIKQLSGIQKRLVSSAIKVLKVKGEMIYSTCTHAPEENEEVVNFILENFPEMKLQKINLPSEIKTRPGITKWNNKVYSKELNKAVRIYPQDNNTEGFFLAKFKKIR